VGADEIGSLDAPLKDKESSVRVVTSLGEL